MMIFYIILNISLANNRIFDSFFIEEYLSIELIDSICEIDIANLCENREKIVYNESYQSFEFQNSQFCEKNHKIMYRDCIKTIFTKIMESKFNISERFFYKIRESFIVKPNLNLDFHDFFNKSPEILDYIWIQNSYKNYDTLFFIFQNNKDIVFEYLKSGCSISDSCNDFIKSYNSFFFEDRKKSESLNKNRGCLKEYINKIDYKYCMAQYLYYFLDK
ncbi:hypothetical protein JXR93_13945, partial [bacterium]|nr:hypothetical protein [bacterium]